MKSKSIVLLVLFLCTMTACETKKEPSIDELYAQGWELVYISGPRIAFDGLFPDKKPTLSFDQDTKKVSGSDSCNGYVADFTLDGASISFGEPGPTTMMFCGQGEKQFLAMMKKIDGLGINDKGQLELFLGDVPMLRFKKLEPAS